MLTIMAMPGRTDLLKLDVAARLELIEALWESIVDDEDAAAELPLTDVERSMLEERLREYRAGHATLRPWPEVREEILKKPRAALAVSDRAARDIDAAHVEYRGTV